MKITELTQDGKLLQAIRDRQAASDVLREGGLHLSTIINDIARTLYPSEYGRDDIEDGTRRMFYEWGNIIEDVIADVLVQRMGWTKPTPRQCDGIWCSPDGYSPRVATIDEVKACWKSSREFLDSSKFWIYKTQVLSYMRVWGATRGRLHVCFMNGDYKPPFPAPPRTFILRPTSAEIETNWRMITRHAKDRGWLK